MSFLGTNEVQNNITIYVLVPNALMELRTVKIRNILFSYSKILEWKHTKPKTWRHKKSNTIARPSDMREALALSYQNAYDKIISTSDVY